MLRNQDLQQMKASQVTCQSLSKESDGARNGEKGKEKMK
jgi:hypothetical protein